MRTRLAARCCSLLAVIAFFSVNAISAQAQASAAAHVAAAKAIAASVPKTAKKTIGGNKALFATSTARPFSDAAGGPGPTDTAIPPRPKRPRYGCHAGIDER